MEDESFRCLTYIAVPSGFRSDHTTSDNLVRLKTFIRDAFIKKEHVVAVFFYLEKSL